MQFKECERDRIIERQRKIINDLTCENSVLRMALKEAHAQPPGMEATLSDLPPEIADILRLEAECNGLSPEGIRIITANLR